jgi:hypothetical protein
MGVIAYLHTALVLRLAELRERPDRGDSPVPTAIIIGGLAVLAAALVVLATTAVNNWMGKIPTN